MNIQKILEQHKIYIDTLGIEGEMANLSNANLIDANLYGANLIDANLIDANLRGADLRDADLRGANLCCADLSDTILYGTDLSNANLIDANLNNAALSCAALSNANLYGANLRGTRLPDQTFVIMGEEYYVQITNGEYIKVGCRSHTVEEWRKYSKRDIAEMDGRRALKFYPRLLDIIDFYLGRGERPEWVSGFNTEEI